MPSGMLHAMITSIQARRGSLYSSAEGRAIAEQKGERHVERGRHPEAGPQQHAVLVGCFSRIWRTPLSLRKDAMPLSPSKPRTA